MDIKLEHGRANNTSCQINRFGATVTSWVVEGIENIFVSSKAVLDGSKAIRGGIPVCFPAFGPWKYGSQHGFARNSKDWKVVQGPVVDEKTGNAVVSLALEDSDETRKIWDRKFTFLYTITLTPKSLELSVDIENRGEQKLDMTFALHTYYKVPDVTKCTVSGLKGLTYVDKVLNGQESQETRDEVKVAEFTDRVYKNSPDEVILTGLTGGRKIKLTKDNIADTVVWNPWAENAAKMSDFGDSEYPNMICVEAVQTSKEIMLDQGEHWVAKHALNVMD